MTTFRVSRRKKDFRERENLGSASKEILDTRFQNSIIFSDPQILQFFHLFKIPILDLLENDLIIIMS